MINQLNEKIRDSGWDFDAKDLTLDGNRHDLKTDTFKGQYIGSKQTDLSGIEVITLTAWDWKESTKQYFRVTNKALTKEQIEKLDSKQKEEQRKLEEGRKKLQDEIAARASKEWQEIKDNGETPRYLIDKGLENIWKETRPVVRARSQDGYRDIKESSLIIPTQDINGKIWGLQTIDPSGQKMFIDGQRTSGLFTLIGKINPEGVIYICEGFATGLTIYGCTGKTTAVAFNAHNLPEVAKTIRKVYSDIRIVVSGDNDQWKRNRFGVLYRTGYHKSREACRISLASHCEASFEYYSDEEKERERPTDFNDLFLFVKRKEGEPKAKRKVKAQIKAHKEIHPLEYIPTEHMGFHTEIETKQGIKHRPEPLHLAQFFHRETNYVSVPEMGMVYVYRDGVYEPFSKGELESYAQEKFTINNEPSTTVRLATEFVGAARRSFTKPHSWFHDSTEGLIAFENGVLNPNPDSWEFKAHSPDYGFRAKLPYKYEPGADCPRFREMMRGVCCGDEELQAQLLEFVGMGLSNESSKLDTALILVGEGSNGKSTFLNIVRALAGEKNCAAISLSKIGFTTSRKLLDGRLFNISEENSQRGIDTEVFKALVTGGTVTAKALYKDEYEFRNRAKFILAFNEFDRAAEQTTGFYRRLLIAPFNAEFSQEKGNKDMEIEKALVRELPGIFNWVMEHYKRARDRGYITVSQAARASLEELKEHSDHVGLFIQENLTFPNGGWKKPTKEEEDRIRKEKGIPEWFKFDESGPYVISSGLYESYVNWCRDSGYKAIVKHSLSKRIIRAGNKVTDGNVSSELKRVSQRALRVIRGVSFVD